MTLVFGDSELKKLKDSLKMCNVWDCLDDKSTAYFCEHHKTIFSVKGGASSVRAPKNKELKVIKERLYDVAKMEPSNHLGCLGGSELEFVRNCVMRVDINVPAVKEKALLLRYNMKRKDKPIYHVQDNKYGLQIRIWLKDDTDVDTLCVMLPHISNKPTRDSKGKLTISDNAFAWELIDKGLVTPTNKNKEEHL